MSQCKAVHYDEHGKVVAVCTRSLNHHSDHHAFDGETDIRWTGEIDVLRDIRERR
ncbi:hypothetical protein [Mycolicibacterium bacteremicum]|uniref:hypothetical protein n=1 Tax=Mycolicibacterium bacteremicum TaxID=564198 RepID=UPI0013FD1F4A|nr:hypothetical protein [Mycolicibacterium bacteremicum]MCV7434832.1 hypothetical protein [Mycolicibacterium bacteremicum]